MSERGWRRIAWSLSLLCVAATASGFALRALSHRGLLGEFAGMAGVLGTTFPLLGALIASKHPRNSVGWVFIALGLSFSFFLLLTEYGGYGLVAHRAMPASEVIGWIGDSVWVPGFGLLMMFPLLFPNGRPPSPRWRPVLWLIGGATVLAFVVRMWGNWQYRGPMLLPSGVGTPFTNGPWRPLVDGYLFLPGGIASVASLLFRVRRSNREVRQQIRWVGYATLLVFSAIVVDFAFADRPVITLPLLPLIPAAAAVAILKYRLYDIDVVINKTLVYGALAGFISLVYVGIVVGIGTAIGQGDRPNLALSILATAVVAVAFQPVRERVQRFANRFVYGKRATPYEVLSHFGERMASTFATQDLLPRMAQILAEGTGAARTEVWLKVGSELRRAASWPESDGDSPRVLPLSAGELPLIDDTDRSVPVRHQGELLGALAMAKSRGDPLTPGDTKLLDDLASQAGLVLRNVKLIEELRASRQRIVSAQDEERRRLERNIHDGAQQQLVALNVKLGLAKALLSKDAEKSQQMIEQLQSETQDALDNLRDLARGIYPPLLRDKGLVAALEAQARKVPVPVRVEADGIGRYREEIEATIYFCVLEALQNVVKYAAATNVVVGVRREGADLVFEVSDDGRGFDPTVTTGGTGLQGMTDRLDAVGGSFSVNSQAGAGATVVGRVPAVPVATDAAPSELEPVG